MTDLAQPMLVALMVVLVPATARWLWKRVEAKLDEGRQAAIIAASETRQLLTNYQVEAERIFDERHTENIVRFDRIEAQTLLTNGKVAEHDKQLTVVSTKTEMLTEMLLGRQPDKGA